MAQRHVLIFSGKIAYQKFLDGQILGLIPISTKTYNLIWSIDERKIDDLISGTKKEMLNILNTELEEKTGTISDCSTYNLFPLSKTFLLQKYHLNLIY